MEQKITQLDLIRFIYKETSSPETLSLRQAMSKDPLLQEEYEELFGSYRQLPKAKFSPKLSTLNKILRYSEQIALNPMH